MKDLDHTKLNIACAERMGRSHCPNCPDQGWYFVGAHGDQEQCQWCETVESSIFKSPSYTTDADAALTLVECALETDDYEVEIYLGTVAHIADSGKIERLWRVRFLSLHNNVTTQEEHAATLPLAIVLAFLKLHGIDPEKL